MIIDLIDEGDPEDELERWEQALKDRNASENGYSRGAIHGRICHHEPYQEALY
jgi:hypothetical protein